MQVEKVVTKIVDGDTINVEPFPDGENSVRLLGIDAPETNYQGRSQGPHAEAATTFLKQRVQMGDRVHIETDEEERDGFGRVLAYVFKEGENLNVTLVEEGLAIPYQIYPNLRFFEEVRLAALSARSHGKGIYSSLDPLAELPFEFRMRIDKRSPHKYVGDNRSKLYYNPIEYQQVALEDRVFFFTERDATAARYRLRAIPVRLAHILDKAYEGLIFGELLNAPVSALTGLSERDADLLKEAFGIKTIGDLAENRFFVWARAIKDLAK